MVISNDIGSYTDRLLNLFEHKQKIKGSDILYSLGIDEIYCSMFDGYFVLRKEILFTDYKYSIWSSNYFELRPVYRRELNLKLLFNNKI